ncbi:MAG: HAMP domain-containing protein [Leptospirales bacterium]|nr:HAMP domain-containing protein [Leptospirales bacterium]
MRILFSVRGRIISILLLGLLLNLTTAMIALIAARKANDGLSEYNPVLQGLQSIMISSTEGHLWFEEMISGDESNKYETIQKLWLNAARHAEAIENGGTVDQISYVKPRSSQHRMQAKKIREAIVRLEALGRERIAGKGNVGSDADQAFDDQYRAIMSLSHQLESETEALVAGEQRFVQSMQWLMPLLTAISSLLYLVGGTILYRSISKPMQRIVGEFSQIRRQNDLSVRFATNGRDEIGLVMQASDSLLEQLCGTFTDIQSAAIELEGRSERLNSSAQDFARVATSQAAVVEEASATVEELSAAVERITETVTEQTSIVGGIAQNVRRLADHVGQSARRIEDARAVAVETSRAQQEGRTELRNASAAIERSKESAGKIRQVIAVIREIADRVSLLSLNASIEAARAGEHGRGFAIVAEEVSKLADRTAASVKEIENLIESVAGTIDSGAAATDRVVSLLDGLMTGVHRLEGEITQVQTDMDSRRQEASKIAGTVSGIHDAAQLIRSSASEQKSALSEISTAIAGIVRDASSLTAGVDEVVQVASGMKASATGLRAAASVYRLPGEA